MTLQEIFALLIKHQALIVHCAGMAKGIGSSETNQLSYLDRLERATRNDLELSCSTVVPNDECSFDRANYTGKVGLVLRPNSTESVTFASPSDAGSQIDPTRPGRRTHNCGPVTLSAIDAAISGRRPNSCNELGLYNFSVVGVFVDPPIQYSSETGFHDVSVEEVALHFPTHALFCLRGGIIHSCAKVDAAWKLGPRVPASDLYK